MKHTELNTIFRQELVSMFPVSLLSPIPNDRILDMCASPGSKTIQILEAITENPSILSQGYCIASEIDEKRASMLAHQTLKLNSPALLILNEDSLNIPIVKGNFGFNKILCDVPCSGDGTTRKNGIILKSWSHKYGVKLHETQKKLLFKGLNLLDKGGILIYSTCSLNPIENEAVVNAALIKLKGKIELLDLGEKGLLKDEPIWKNGLTKWKVYSKVKKNEFWFEKYGDVPKEVRCGITESMFPGEENEFLIRTRRIYQHLNNTGGFYLAMFRKVLDFEEYKEEKNTKKHEKKEVIIYKNIEINELGKTKSSEKEKEQEIFENKTEKNDLQKSLEKEKLEEILNITNGENKKKIEKEQIIPKNEEKNNLENANKNEEKKESDIKPEKDDIEGVIFGLQLKNFLNILERDPEIYKIIEKFYGFNSKFPSNNLYGVDPAPENLTSFRPKRLILLNEGLKKFLSLNQHFKDLKTVSLGVNVFKFIREEKLEIKFRVLIESFNLLKPYVIQEKNRIISVEFEDFKCLVSIKNNEKIDFLPENLQRKIRAFSQGPFIIEYKIEDQEFYLIFWKGISHINQLMKVQDIIYLKFRLSLRDKFLL